MAAMTRSCWKGLTTKSLAPERMASTTLASWPRAEHITTRALGSDAMISLRAARPSFSGIVMSIVQTSGFRRAYCSTASAPLAASPTTS